MHNVCRHRGSLVCDSGNSTGASLVCPYHHWTYDLEGRLLASPGVEIDDPAMFSLRRINVAEASGFIFVHLAPGDPRRFESSEQLDEHLRAYQLDRARIAATIDYRVAANWKVIFENNRECLHCGPNHPEYCRATFDLSRDAGVHQDRVVAQMERLRPILARNGIDARRLGVSSAMTAGEFRLNHTPLIKGFITESLDGRPVAPPLGTLDTVDVGTARVTAFPNYWCHVSGDHAVTTRLLPVAAGMTDVRVTWLVHGDAVEGRDYDLTRLLPFWKNTSEQDWTICERVQQGVATSGYIPGPLSPVRESHVDHFLRWYLAELRK